MTDRHVGYVVTLDGAVREDDAEAILTAMKMIKGVASVDPVIDDPKIQIAKSAAHSEWERKIIGLVYPPQR